METRRDKKRRKEGACEEEHQSISIKRKKQTIERRSDHIGGSSSSSGKGRKVPLLTYILKAVAMQGDIGDGDDDDPPPPPPPLPPSPAVLLLMMMTMALATAPLFKLSAAAEQQTEQSQRAARNFYCPLLLQPQRSSRAATRQNTNRTSTEHRQKPSTEHQQNINRTSTEHQQNFDRASTELRQNINSSSCIRVSFIHHTLSSLRFLIIFGGRSFSLFFFFFPGAPTRQNISTEHPQKILRQLFALGFFIHPPHTLSSSHHHLSIWVFPSLRSLFFFSIFSFLSGEGGIFFHVWWW